jgi:hypothetical protein
MRTKYVLGVVALAVMTNISYAVWSYPHGDSANTGFAKQVTAPAARPMRTAPVGELSSGAGPVVGPDGTVYIGNVYGQVLAFHADGSPAWSRQLPKGQWVTSSPVVGADGSVYVVAETRFLIEGSTSDYRYESTLHKFSPSGGWLYQAPFPQRWGGYPYSSRGDANAAPNIWRSNGVEAIIVPAIYGNPVYTSLRLIAFSTSGAVLGDTLAWEPSPGTVTDSGGDYSFLPSLCGDAFCFYGKNPNPQPLPCTDFSVCLPEDTTWPLPGVAIWQNPRGETPTVMVSNGLQDTVGYTFDPAHGFTERFRVHDTKRSLASAAVVLPDGHTVVAASSEKLNRLTFAGPNFAPLADLTGPLGEVAAAPTRMPDGRLIAIEFGGGLAAFSGGNVLSAHINLIGQSIASAASSCNYLYVASAGALTTFSISSTLAPVATVQWYGGGRSSPAIGPGGHVYAVAMSTDHVTSIMYVFPPLAPPATTFAGTACAPSGSQLGASATK